MAGIRIAGICYVKVDGAQYAARGSFEVQPFTTKKEAVVGSDAPHGFKEMPIVPHIKGKFTDLPGISVSALQNITQSTITIECANGKTYILRDAWVRDEITVNTEEGEYEVTFEGLACIERGSGF